MASNEYPMGNIISKDQRSWFEREFSDPYNRIVWGINDPIILPAGVNYDVAVGAFSEEDEPLALVSKNAWETNKGGIQELIYVALEKRKIMPLLKCPKCHLELNSKKGRYCNHCGAAVVPIGVLNKLKWILLGDSPQSRASSTYPKLFLIGVSLIVLGWFFDGLLVSHVIQYTPNLAIESVGLFLIGFSRNKSWNNRWQAIWFGIWFLGPILTLNYFLTGLPLSTLVSVEGFVVILYSAMLGLGYGLSCLFLSDRLRKFTAKLRI